MLDHVVLADDVRQRGPGVGARGGNGRPMRGSPAGSDSAIRRQHQARLAFSPCRWAICPSAGSETTAGVNSVAGSPPAIPGRNTDSQVPNSVSGRIRGISSASHSAGDRKSCPDGSQAPGYMVSPANHS